MTFTEEEKFDYYYVSYSGGSCTGCVIIPQHKPVGGGENPDGMNIANAHQYLVALFGAPMVIVYFCKTTRKRKEEFDAFVRKVNGVKAESALKLTVSNEAPVKSEEPRPPAELKVIEPDYTPTIL